MKSLNWTQATTELEQAILGVLSCRKAGYKAWIEIANNADVPFPIQIKNPALNDPESWTMSYGIPKPAPKDEQESFFNDTEKDLYYNYDYSFRRYRCEKGHIHFEKKQLFANVKCPKCGKESSQFCGPVKLKDPHSRTWITIWQAKKDVPYWIPDPKISDVYVIAHDTDKTALDEKQCLLEIADFIQKTLKS